MALSRVTFVFPNTGLAQYPTATVNKLLRWRNVRVHFRQIVCRRKYKPCEIAFAYTCCKRSLFFVNTTLSLSRPCSAYIVPSSIFARTDRDTQGLSAPATSTTITAVTPCRRRCDSSTVSKTNGRTNERTDAGNRI